MCVLFVKIHTKSKEKQGQRSKPTLVCLLHLCEYSQDLSQCVSCKEKHITVKKEPHESLGMTVAGGRGSKSGELPIFVTSVQPHGCLSRDGRIKRGEFLSKKMWIRSIMELVQSETIESSSSLRQVTSC